MPGMEEEEHEHEEIKAQKHAKTSGNEKGIFVALNVNVR